MKFITPYDFNVDYGVKRINASKVKYYQDDIDGKRIYFTYDDDTEVQWGWKTRKGCIEGQKMIDKALCH